MIAPPYSPDFVSLMLPIVKNKEITDTLRTSNEEDDVSQFLSKFDELSQERNKLYIIFPGTIKYLEAREVLDV